MPDFKLSEGQAWVIMEALETHPVARAITVMRGITPIVVTPVITEPVDESVPAGAPVG